MPGRADSLECPVMTQTDTTLPEMEPFPRRLHRFYKFHSRIYDHTR